MPPPAIGKRQQTCGRYKQQLDIAKPYLSKDGMLDYEKAGKEWWLFFDWRDGLDKQAALQGVVIWAYKNTYELAKLLGKETEVADLPDIIKTMKAATHKNLYDKAAGVFVSGKNKQVSYASQAWMVLSGVASERRRSESITAVAWYAKRRVSRRALPVSLCSGSHDTMWHARRSRRTCGKLLGWHGQKRSRYLLGSL